MFERINYLILIALIALLAFMVIKDGKASWKESRGKSFYAIAAQPALSAEERERRYGEIEELIDAKQLEKALLLLKQKESKYNSDAHFYFLMGKTYAKMKLYKEAMPNFLKAAKYDPLYVDKPPESEYDACEREPSPEAMLIRDITKEALAFYKDKNDSESKEALRVVYAMQRRLAGGCE